MEIQINNELRDRAYDNACKHGFHDKEYSDEHWLMLIITEISEAVNADRNGRMANIDAFKRLYSGSDSKFGYEKLIKGSVEEELADVVIRCLDFAAMKGININVKTYSYTEKLSFEERMYWICSSFTFINNEFEFENRINDAIDSITSLAKINNIDLLWYIEQKMRYNELREPMHGKKY